MIAAARQAGELTGVSANGHTDGDAHVTDVLRPHGAEEVRLRRHVLAFFQGNRFLLEALVAHVAGQVDEASAIVDLYAGVGLFAAGAAVWRGCRVTAVEGDPIAAADLAYNAAPLGGAVEAVHRSVEDVVRGGPRSLPRGAFAAAVVDPPRTGLSRDALAGICALQPPRLVYVSCDVATLARDARVLVDHGYEPARVDAFDLFPNTPHVETVAVFQRT
jgi:tRNA/tmRNA/rRNA uracil-C5-methylase (TrmA/RlmC/RlmD family)